MTGMGFKGRGAISAIDGRFAATSVEDATGVAAVAPETVLKPMPARKIISSNRSPDVPFDRSINPYQGCEHGCVYCYARPSHSYLDLSPGLDFESRIFYKPNAAAALLEAWSKPGYEVQPIAIGANTDPYQPAERTLGVTRSLLELFLAHRHPVSLITKGALITRDIDLLGELAARGLASVAVSIPTLDRDLKRVLEPRVPDARLRLKAMDRLAAAGIPVTLLMAPIIPAVNDREIEAIVARAAEHGARQASRILLRLPHEVKDIFAEWLKVHLPERADKVMSLIRQSSGGRAYDHRFGVRQSGTGAYAKMLGDRFRAACSRHGLNAERRTSALDCSQFLRPGQPQMTLDFG